MAVPMDEYGRPALELSAWSQKKLKEMLNNEFFTAFLLKSHYEKLHFICVVYDDKRLHYPQIGYKRPTPGLFFAIL